MKAGCKQNFLCPHPSCTSSMPARDRVPRKKDIIRHDDAAAHTRQRKRTSNLASPALFSSSSSHLLSDFSPRGPSPPTPGSCPLYRLRDAYVTRQARGMQCTLLGCDSGCTFVLGGRQREQVWGEESKQQHSMSEVSESRRCTLVESRGLSLGVKARAAFPAWRGLPVATVWW